MLAFVRRQAASALEQCGVIFQLRDPFFGIVIQVPLPALTPIERSAAVGGRGALEKDLALAAAEACSVPNWGAGSSRV